MYIASADFMTRNTVRRVEVAAPVYDPAIRERIRYIFDTIMKDDEKEKSRMPKAFMRTVISMRSL